MAQLFDELARIRPNDQRLANYAWAASLFGQIKLFPRSEKQCSLLIALGPEGNPFYDKARLYRARFLRAHGQEGHVAEVLATAQKIFRELKAKAPDNIQLRELTGESVPWGEELINRYPDAPRWAALLHEIYIRQLTIMNWWFTERQYPDGQLGGGWGDDVELLRSWGPFALISNADPVVRDGIGKLCQGVWDHVLRDGYAPDIGDVEHSAEPSADSIPTMLALRYGDPLWYERNLASCRRIRDYYTAVDNKGFIRFKSGHFGGEGVSEHLQHGGDNHYCARPMKHFLWAAWYGNEGAKDFYVDWVRGWTSATMTAAYTKPAGVPPASIWYPSGDIAPPNGVAAWNDPVYNIYGCCRIGEFRIQDTFLAGYYFSGDPYFLQPLHAWMRFYESQMPLDAPKNPTIEENATVWAIRNSKDTWKSDQVLAQYRWMTADSTYDELFHRQRIQHRLHLPGDFDHLVARLEATVKRLRTNFNLYTREVLQTDRAGLPGSELAFSVFTGAVREWKDAGVPTMAVTWEFPSPDFAAIVPYATKDHLRAWIYNFSKDKARVGMYLWRLQPGRYDVRTGLLGKGQGYLRKQQWHEPVYITLRHKGDMYQVDIPSRKEYVIDLRLVNPQPRPNGAADAAIAQRDVTITQKEEGKFTVNVTIHNLGNRAVKNLTVALQRADRQESSEIARKTIDLPGCRDLQPRSVTISFMVADPKTELAMVLDPQQKVLELNELNNRVDVPRFRK